MIFALLFSIKQQKMKKYLLITLLAISSGYVGAFLFNYQYKKAESPASFISTSNDTPAQQFVATTSSSGAGKRTALGPSDDFVEASRISTQSVVYIKNISERVYMQSFMDMFFDMGGQ